MIAAESKTFTYLMIAERWHLTGSDEAKRKFVQRRVANGELRAIRLSGRRTPIIAELDLLKYENDRKTWDGLKKKGRKT